MSTKSQTKKLFGKNPTSFFANKISLEDSEENIKSGDALVSDNWTFFFQNTKKTLNIHESLYNVDSSSSITDPANKAIRILLKKQKLENVDYFSFKEVQLK